ncbi:MAG: Ig-like domain-containing protein [Deltaproteobacteria bacterium]|nr:Ig-like domain-containing protein [Deltaproteobacteria bacterium]
MDPLALHRLSSRVSSANRGVPIRGALVALACVALAACGDDDDKTKDTGGGDTTADTTDTSTTDTTATETTTTETTTTETIETETVADTDDDTGTTDASETAEETVETDVADDADGVTPPTERVVFGDDYGADVSFKPFGGATNALSIDTAEKYAGAASLKIVVPASGYTGGALAVDVAEDLSGWDAITFWARASTAAALNVVGIGNDATATTLQVEWNALPLTTSWQKFTVPIPDPALFDAETGLFHFAEGAEAAEYTIWLDDIQYVNLDAGVLGTPMPAIATETITREVGGTAVVNGASLTIPVNGTNQTLALARPWLTYETSDDDVATVDASGTVTAVGVGQAVITATFGAIDANGALTVNVSDPALPAAAAPTPPSLGSDDVLSLFSNAFTNATVDTWSAGWDQADVSDVLIAGDDAKKYTSLVFAGVEFTSATLDATDFTHFHIDVWSPDATVFKVKLVDFGANGTYDGGDDKEHELTFDATTTPALVQKQWVSLDIPLADFTNLTTRGHLAQLILVSSNATVYVDNVYFYVGAPTEPTSAAPTPSHASGEVTSLFSNAYTNVTVDTWSAGWDVADVADVQVAGDDTKKYTNLVFAGIEFTSSTIDATGKTHFHIDVWSASAATFKVKLVDFGANGTYDGGDDKEHELTFDESTTPTMRVGEWSSLDIPLSSFTNLTTRGHLAQLILVSSNPTVYIDNVYFH